MAASVVVATRGPVHRDPVLAAKPDGTPWRNSGAASAFANSWAVPNRSAGSFSNPFRTAASTLGGTERRCAVAEGGASSKILASTACALPPR